MTDNEITGVALDVLEALMVLGLDRHDQVAVLSSALAGVLSIASAEEREDLVEAHLSALDDSLDAAQAEPAVSVH